MHFPWARAPQALPGAVPWEPGLSSTLARSDCLADSGADGEGGTRRKQGKVGIRPIGAAEQSRFRLATRLSHPIGHPPNRASHPIGAIRLDIHRIERDTGLSVPFGHPPIDWTPTKQQTDWTPAEPAGTHQQRPFYHLVFLDLTLLLAWFR